MNYGLESAEKVVMAGSSAGGSGVLFWIDELTHMVSDKSKVSGIMDSNIFLDPVFALRMDNIKKLQKAL